MKKLCIILAVSRQIVACFSNDLSRDKAMEILKKDGDYLKVVDFDISCGDPQRAAKVLEAGLETQGLLTVRRTQKLMDAGKPLINFTDKAKPYLLPTPEKDQEYHIQKVKLADESLLEVTGIKMGANKKKAMVEYTTTYKNITPFAALVKTDFKEVKKNKKYFSWYDDGWRLEKKPGIEFLEFELK